MKRLIFFLLFVVAAWYGWKRWPDLVTRVPGHEAVVENASGMTMEAVRLSVDGQKFVKEVLPNEQTAVFPFKVTNDATFHLEWQWKEKDAVRQWRGGLVPRGPMVQRHTMQVDGDGGVVYTARMK